MENINSESQAFMGSTSNAFSLEGLGYERKPGVLTGVSHFETSIEASGLKAMFDGIWENPALVEDVTNEVVEQIQTLYRENSPELVYFLTLYHLFRKFIEDEEDPIRPGLRFEESVVWNKLYEFQRDAVVGAIRKLEKYKGCIIADSVGLGKTYEALAGIKYYQERNSRVLVLCPKRLRNNWTLWTRGNDDRKPLAEDRFSYDVLNHTDLSRYYGMSGEIDLEHLRWNNYDLIVIDESHNFRNKSTDAEKKDRYTRLIEDIIKTDVRTKVLMLSATPVNNKLLDLRNQIELITEGDDEYLAGTDGIPSITQVIRVAQARFNEWSKLDDAQRTTESFVNAVHADYFKLLDVLTIARSRKHITKYYGAASGTFPTRRPPLSFQTPIDAKGELPAISELNDMIAQLSFAQYQVLSYVRHDKQSKYEACYGDTWGKNFESQVNRTTAVANLMRVNVLKRMESSVNSFRITLQRILNACIELKNRLDNVDTNRAYEKCDSSFEFDDEDDAEEFVAGGKIDVDLHDVDALRLSQDLDFDIERNAEGIEERLGYEKSKHIFDYLSETGMIDIKGAVTPELKTSAQEGKVELPAELEPAAEQVADIIILFASLRRCRYATRPKRSPLSSRRMSHSTRLFRNCGSASVNVHALR
ncbi:DEAD/DEAH box helicase family protein [Collinsella sp. AGMB00827]|uniref:DEAD/DEAH box helicase family protein n=1 Tax=Collinsella ureilytica TaxID=2869515 RepID=A0ABS7MLX0_9ACTN|nr:DEAD/DEAH box helicase family protein [Collinsella urealyticum]